VLHPIHETLKLERTLSADFFCSLDKFIVLRVLRIVHEHLDWNVAFLAFTFIKEFLRHSP